MSELNLNESFELVDIKFNKIDEKTLDLVANKIGSYEAIFSKKARKYNAIKAEIKNDADFKKLMLEEYTFLKRPFFINGSDIYVGNDKKAVENMKTSLENA